MNANECCQSDDDRIATSAAAWVVKLDRGLLPEDRLPLERWLRADPRHAAVLAEMTDAWNVMADAPVPSAGRVHSRRNASFRRWIALAAAAALVTGYVAWWKPSLSPLVESVSTDVGGWRRVELPDGSVVQLNTNSAIDAQYTVSERRVHLLRGEAHFSVAKNRFRPFLVDAQGIDVRAIGTAFNVRIFDHSIDVLVTEGSVAVGRRRQLDMTPSDAGLRPRESQEAEPAPAAGPRHAALPADLVLSGGQRALIPRPAEQGLAAAEATVAPMPPAEIERVLAWREHQLQFSGETLAGMAAEFNRYNARHIVLGDADLASRRFGGTFPADDCESFVRLLEREFGVAAERHPDVIILRPAP